MNAPSRTPSTSAHPSRRSPSTEAHPKGLLAGLRRAKSRRVSSAAERGVLALLDRLDFGTLTLTRANGQSHRYGQPTNRSVDPIDADLHLHDDTVFAHVLRHGDIGLAEAYIQGHWDTRDLPGLLRLVMRNRDVLERVVYGSVLGALTYRLRHALRRNTQRGSRKNIQAHYDLGNDFYGLWLDETWSYSSALFGGDATRTLAQAQHAKIDRALDQARVQAGSRVLEIGCGWGSLAARAAQRGATVQGVTLSHEQLAFGQAALQRAGLSERASLALQDYRSVGAQADFKPFDAVVSIEMFEAVGQPYWADYFNTLARCLAPQARACVQSIVIRDDLFARYARSTDFIQQYVFPGGMLPSAAVFRAEAAKAGLAVDNELAFGGDYARTLAAWRHAYGAQQDAVRALGYDTSFLRLWDFYLAYCQAAFETGNTDVMQFTLRRT
jgi:cyclopropane-fatty-acyl-phospholipid synthase